MLASKQLSFLMVAVLWAGSLLVLERCSSRAMAQASGQPDAQTVAKPVDEWPQWRGPRGDALPVIEKMPQDFSKGLKQLWEVKDLCAGKNAAAWGCPAIMGDKLVVAGRDGDKDTVRCFNSDTGVEVWKADYDAAAGEKDQVQYGVGSRATPTIDGGLVYTYGCLGHIACWQLADGKQVWLKKATDMGGQRPMWGFASSPLVLDDKVIVQPGGQGQLLALDKKTGEKVWASPAGPAGYSTPALVTIAGKQQLIATSGAAIAAFDPKCGGKLWEAPWATAFGMNCTTPMMVGGKLLISSSNVDKKHGGEGLFEVGEGGLKAVWTTLAFGAAHNDPVVIAGMLYAYSGYSMDDKGTLVCADMTTGQIKWSSKEVAGPGTVLQVGKQILCLGNRGKLTLIDPSPEGFKKVTEFQAIDGYPVWTVPVITHNKLYVRWTEHLICYAIAQ